MYYLLSGKAFQFARQTQHNGHESVEHRNNWNICSAFLPMVETLCDPDYINQTILMYFQNREATVEDQSRAYAYAATYEDFIKIINDCKSVSVLRQIR